MAARRASYEWLVIKKRMARAGVQLGQVVWAKLTGYPWWPGLVSSTQIDRVVSDPANPTKSLITVKFLGENSQ